MNEATRFWRVRPASATRDTWVDLADESYQTGVELELTQTPLTERIAGGWQPPEPIPLKAWNRGKYDGDLLHAGGSFFVVASNRLCALLEAIGATGWVTAPVEIRYKDGEELPGYRLFVTTGRCADFLIDRDDHDEDVLEQVDVSVGWDGSDVFWFAAMSNGFVVTDRVKRAIEAAGLERIEFEVPMS